MYHYISKIVSQKKLPKFWVAVQNQKQKITLNQDLFLKYA